jgi:hypothetical protein
VRGESRLAGALTADESDADHAPTPQISHTPTLRHAGASGG